MELLTDEQRALFVGGGCLADYDVIKPIGKGKFSVVYKAQRRRDAVPVALKKIAIFDLMDTRAREKTLKEVRLVQSVSHEHIIQYMDAFLDDKELHIAFEWADAGDLKRQIRKAAERQVRLDERTIWRYFSQICAAIRYLHTARIMHRDLKPANIFLTTQGMVKVGDLGLGRHLSENTLEARSKVGTPLYMSPEVLRGEGYDWKSDVWSLGCILYELAMLRSPFKSEGLNLYGLFQKINKGDYEPLPDVYSEHLRALATQMISLDAAQRPTMEAVWVACQARPSTAVLSQREAPTRPSSNQSQKESTQTSHATVKHETPSPSSRPVSQQSDTTPRSTRQPTPPTRSEPQTTASVTEEELAQRQEHATMELLYDRLRLLASTSTHQLLRRLTRHHFSSASRAIPQWTRSSQERFEEMVRVAKYLIELCGDSSHKQIDTMQPPIVQAQMLLLAVERVGVNSLELASVNAPSLTGGSGLQVCLLLNALSVKALDTTRAERKTPVYSTEIVDDVDADDQWEVQSDDHASHSASTGESTTSTTHRANEDDGGEDDGLWMDPRWLVAREATVVNEDMTMIHTRVDVLAWAREFECVRGRLEQRWKESQATVRSRIMLEWVPRLEALHMHSSSVKRAWQPTRDPLRVTSEVARTDRRRLTVLEHRIESEHGCSIKTEYQAASLRLQQSLATARHLQEAVDERTAARAAVDTARQSAQQYLDEVNSRVTDTSPLLRLKTQLKHVQQESDAMGIQVEVLDSQLWRKRIRRPV